MFTSILQFKTTLVRFGLSSLLVLSLSINLRDPALVPRVGDGEAGVALLEVLDHAGHGHLAGVSGEVDGGGRCGKRSHGAQVTVSAQLESIEGSLLGLGNLGAEGGPVHGGGSNTLGSHSKINLDSFKLLYSSSV